ncbi:MAG TPA: gamma-glutamyl-gamma-aminobutyrate hydrolase family protein [Pyrinomonadaceae bacterium]
MNKQPRIGIPMRIESTTDRFYLSRFYSEALEAAGAIPLHISLIPNADYVNAAVKGLDGILLPGSDSDVDPLRYGHEPHRALGTVQPIKDETDLLVIAAAERNRIPLFAICFGMQILNVYRGGTLIQDIASQVSDSIKHEQGAPRDRRSHSVKLLPGSMLEQLAGGEHQSVNSHHHQAIEVIGRDLVATAWSTDGLVEAFEDPRREPFVMAVQWHPELGWDNDEFSQAIFRHFINQVRDNKHRQSEVSITSR